MSEDTFFQEYCRDKLYKSMASKDFFIKRLDETKMLALLDGVFANANSIMEARATLEGTMSSEGLDRLIKRYQGVKSARKRRNAVQPVEVIRRVREGLSQLMHERGHNTYTEVLLELMDPDLGEIKKGHLDKQLSEIGLVATFEMIVSLLAQEHQFVIHQELRDAYRAGFADGCKSVPVNMENAEKAYFEKKVPGVSS